MEKRMKENITSSDIWVRALYMVMFGIAFSITKAIIIFLVLFQFISVLFNGRANEQLLRFGRNLTNYIHEILEFQTFNSEIRPFPFTPWPDDEPGGEYWVGDYDDLDDEDDLDDDTEAREEPVDEAPAAPDEDKITDTPDKDSPKKKKSARKKPKPRPKAK